MTPDLFDSTPPDMPACQRLAPGALLLRQFAREHDAQQHSGYLFTFKTVTRSAPLRHQLTPGGHMMSVAMTSCGDLGWVSSKSGYCYSPADPQSGMPWPAIPQTWRAMAVLAARRAGYSSFNPDACLINEYAPGAKMGLHQDRDEQDLSQPIVSVSLGLPAVFLFGAGKRTDKPQRIGLTDGDVVVWGGPARLAFHGVAPLADGEHPVWGARRINLTFRRAR